MGFPRGTEKIMKNYTQSGRCIPWM